MSGWCFGYTCLKRLSTFWSIFQTGRTYDLTFAGTNPGSLRFHMMTPTNAATSITPNDAVAALTGRDHCAVMRIFYASPMRLQVYTQDTQNKEFFVGDMNWQGDSHKCRETSPDTCDTYVDQFPTLDSPVGTNSFDSSTNTLWYSLLPNQVLNQLLT